MPLLALCLLTLGSARAQAPDTGPLEEYTVRTGDTLWSIASSAACDMALIRARNNLQGDDLDVGQRLILPEPCDATALLTDDGSRPRRGSRVASANPSSAEPTEPQRAEPRVEVPHPQSDLIPVDVAWTSQEQETVPSAPSEDGTGPAQPSAAIDPQCLYIVARGDTLYGIARARGTTVEALQRANPGLTSAIQPGDRLRLRGCRARGDEDHGALEPPRRVHDGERLEHAMRALGFEPPEGFKALVVEIQFDADRRRVVEERWLDWAGTSADVGDWNPASTVKLFPAIGAAALLGRAGLPMQATATFHGARARSHRVDELVRASLIDSDNIAYDRLVQLVGYGRLHGEILSPARGFEVTELTTAYDVRGWRRLGESPSLLSSPPRTVAFRDAQLELAAESSEGERRCPRSACTSLRELATAMRGVMLQEQLPTEETFELERDALLTIRRSLRAERSRGESAVARLASALRGQRPRLYHKAGFSRGWFSDNVYVYLPNADRAWIVAMTGYGGREVLDDASATIGRLIASRELWQPEAVAAPSPPDGATTSISDELVELGDDLRGATSDR